MKIGRETSIPSLVNYAAGDASNAVRLSSASMAGHTVFNGLKTIQESLTDASASDRRAHESHAD
jgi:hypothetical protein